MTYKDSADVLEQIPNHHIEKYLKTQKISFPNFNNTNEKKFIQFIYDYMKFTQNELCVSFSEDDFINSLVEFIKDNYYLIKK